LHVLGDLAKRAIRGDAGARETARWRKRNFTPSQTRYPQAPALCGVRYVTQLQVDNAERRRL
jgi:hypothetical protein